MRLVLKNFEVWIAQFALVIVACCVFAQVVSRYIFNSALSWTEELSSFAMVWAVYMGASVAVRESFHVRVMLLVKMLPHRAAVVFIIMGDLLWLLFCGIMLAVGWQYISLLWTTEYISPSLGIDQKWPQSIVIIGYLLIVARIIQGYVIWHNSGYEGLPGIADNEDEILATTEDA